MQEVTGEELMVTEGFAFSQEWRGRGQTSVNVGTEVGCAFIIIPI